MSLGMNEKELSELYGERFILIHNGFAERQSKDIQALMATGYSKIEAAAQVTSEIRLLSHAGAILFTIAQNNQRIQAQLEQKGIEI